MNFVQILYKDSKQTSIVELKSQNITSIDYLVLNEQLSDYLIVCCFFNDKKVIFNELLPIEKVINSTDFYDMNTINDNDFSLSNGTRLFNSSLIIPNSVSQDTVVASSTNLPILIDNYNFEMNTSKNNLFSFIPISTALKGNILKSINLSLHYKTIFQILEVHNHFIHVICSDNQNNVLFNIPLDLSNGKSEYIISQTNTDAGTPTEYTYGSVDGSVRVPTIMKEFNFPNNLILNSNLLKFSFLGIEPDNDSGWFWDLHVDIHCTIFTQ